MQSLVHFLQIVGLGRSQRGLPGGFLLVGVWGRFWSAVNATFHSDDADASEEDDNKYRC